MRPSTARGLVLLTAVLFSTGGAAIKAVALTNWQVACIRSAIAAIVLLLFAGRTIRITKAVLLVGAVQAATLVTFVTANKLTTAANSVFFQGTAPLYIALIGPMWLGERLPRRDYPVLGAIAAGILLLFFGSASASATAPNPALGNIIGVISGVFWALTVMGLRWLERREHDATGTIARSAAVTGNVMTCLVCLPFALPLVGAKPTDFAILLYLGVFQVGMSYALLTRSIAYIPAVDASLLLLAEPALSPTWAWLVHHESPGFWPMMGGVLIIAATTFKTVRDARGARAAA
jgi:drug/metabolite transporter, DME family